MSDPDTQYTEMREQDAFMEVQALVIQPVVERFRCVRLATGQIVYEFWTDGKRTIRIDANAYDFMLDRAREKMRDEPEMTAR